MFFEYIINSNFLKKNILINTKLSFSAPLKSFELSLIERSCDFVIACHPPESPKIEHRKMFEEEWVIVAPREWKIRKFQVLKEFPFIRHSEMNLDLFVPEFVERKMESGLSIDNLIGIRSAVKEGQGC